MSNISVVYSPKIIILSFGISFLGTYCTICLCEQFRACSVIGNSPKLLNKTGLLTMMACSLGGIGIWSMHFVGMFAMKLVGPNGATIPIQFHVFPTIISLLIVLFFSWVGLWIGSMDRFFTKSKKEINQLFNSDHENLDLPVYFNQGGVMSVRQMWTILCTQSIQYLVGGGVLTAAGVCAMHYLGMWAMELSFEGTIVWNQGIIAASVLIAIIAATVAFWILYRLLSVYPAVEILRPACALLMSIAICGMHYTGMMAAEFKYEAEKTNSAAGVNIMGRMSGTNAFYGALIAAVIFFAILAIITMAGLRAWLITATAQLHKADGLLTSIHKNRYSAPIAAYFEQYGKRKKRQYDNNGNFYGGNDDHSADSSCNVSISIRPSPSNIPHNTPIISPRQQTNLMQEIGGTGNNNNNHNNIHSNNFNFNTNNTHNDTNHNQNNHNNSKRICPPANSNIAKYGLHIGSDGKPLRVQEMVLKSIYSNEVSELGSAHGDSHYESTQE